MGLFSKKKKIYVSSSLYNLAGDINKRTQFLPTTIATKVMSGSDESMSSAITRALLNGSGIKFRSYARWARTSGYGTNVLGITGSTIYVGDNIDLNILASKITPNPGETIVVTTAEVSVADYGYWVDQWMLTNHPTEVTEDYEIDYDELTNTVYITFASDGRVYTMNPVGFDANGVYLYYSWVRTSSNVQMPREDGAEIIVDDKSDWPSITGWTLESSTSTPVTATLTDTRHTVVSYSDGRPDEVTDESQDREFTGNETSTVHYRDFYQGLSADKSSTSTIRRWVTRNTTGKIVEDMDTTTDTEIITGGVIKTTTVTTVTQSVDPVYSYQEDEQVTINSSTSPMQVGIYQKGSNLDADMENMFAQPIDSGSFIPFIPVRIWNRTVREDYGSLYDWNKKAVKKAMDKKYDFVADQLDDNPSIGDIDFAYIVFGVSLNTKENAGRKYIMLFFQYLNTIDGGVAGQDAAWIQWEKDWEAADKIQQAWVKWNEAQSTPLDPLYNTAEPPRATYPAQPYRTIRQYAQNVNYNMSLSYGGIKSQRISGTHPTLKQGKTLFVRGDVGNLQYQELLTSGGLVDTRALDRNTVIMYWQDEADSYLVITVSSLWHNYIIYKGKGVDIHTPDALADEEESGMLIPLHEGIFRFMSLPDATQLSTSCAYMVCNSYKVVKKKWYQSSWFKIVLIVAAIVITVVTWGGGAAASGGILGANAAVGASIGLTATAAIVAGAAINAIAGYIVARIIMAASTAIFGDEVGAIIGSIASVAALSVGTSMASGGTAMQGMQNMTSALNLMKVSVAGLNSYSQVMNRKIDEVADKIEALQESYKKKMTEIYDAWTENLGFDKGIIDIQAMTEAARERYIVENLDSFLTRTLMTGSDIANTTNGMISNMLPATLSTKLP